jgi:hypothetical protein
MCFYWKEFSSPTGSKRFEFAEAILSNGAARFISSHLLWALLLQAALSELSCIEVD